MNSRIKELFPKEIKKLEDRLDMYENATVVVLDVETTGFSVDTCFLTEIGAVKIKNGTVIERFDKFIKLPEGEKVPDIITKLTGITDEMCEDGVKLKVALIGLNHFCKNAHFLVAQNSIFDLGWLLKTALKIDYVNNIGNLLKPMYCTKKIFTSRDKSEDSEELQKTKKSNLGLLCDYYGIKVDTQKQHRADYDAEITGEVFYEQIRNGKVEPYGDQITEGQDAYLNIMLDEFNIKMDENIKYNMKSDVFSIISKKYDEEMSKCHSI